VTIGGYTPIEKVYNYEPVPKELDASKAAYIQGAQGNVWTEYMAYPSKVEYMIFPRISALSEVLWSPKEKRNWNDFEKRLPAQFKRYDLWKVNYSKAYFDLSSTIVPGNYAAPKNNVVWKLGAKNKGDNVRVFYRTPGKGYDVEGPGIELKGKKLPNENAYVFTIDAPGTYAAGSGKNYNSFINVFRFNKATGKKVAITKTPNEKYPGQGGAFSLVNGVYSNKGLSYPDWLGWIGDDMEATIDLGKSTAIDSVRMHTVDQNGSWIYLPQYMEVLTSNDGTKFTSAVRSTEFVKDTLTMGWITVPVQKQTARYIKVLAKNYGMIPDGKAGAGNKAWLFADEIQVN
jgi:hexosaminidase